MQDKKAMMTSAILDAESGEIMVAHPQKEGVFVTTNHFKDLLGGDHDESDCVYTETQVCAERIQIPGNPGLVCVRWTTVKTCRCT